MKLKKILLIDDDPVAMMIAEKNLAALGTFHKIEKARNGREALAVLNHYCEGLTDAPEIIFLDLHMPVMDGFDFLNHYNKMDCIDKSKITLVVLTSSVDEREFEKATKGGAHYIINKPLMKEALRKFLVNIRHENKN